MNYNNQPLCQQINIQLFKSGSCFKYILPTIILSFIKETLTSFVAQAFLELNNLTVSMDEQQNYNYDDNEAEGYEEYNDPNNDYEHDYDYCLDDELYNGYSEVSNKKQYQVIPYNNLLAEVEKQIKSAHQMTALPQGWCLLLLRNFKWDIDWLSTQYFHDISRYRDEIGYKQTYQNPHEIPEIKGCCEVCCLDDLTLYYNICGHGYCESCWKGHLEAAIASNSPFMKCMGCQCPLLHQTIRILLKKLYIDDRKMIDKYQKVICQLFSTIHRNYQFCTGADCNNCIKVYNLNIQTVRCTCGKSFCFKCKSDDHSPCSCQDKKQWLQNVLKQQADAKWMAVNAKLCPWCKKAVQRSAGCNFMACVCGKNFCYLCSRPWQPDHKDHFKCHIYKKSTTQTISREKEILQKMNFFTERYLDNNAIANQNKKVDTFQKRKILFKLLKIDLSDSQFIDSAYKFSIQCCQSLKWIYAYSYYTKWRNEDEKKKFQFDQGQFQKYKVNLLKMLAVDLKNFIKKLEDWSKEQLLELINEFKQLKGTIVNYYTMTKKYKQKFVQEIQGRYDEVFLFTKKSSSSKGPTKIQQEKCQKKNNKQKKQIKLQKKQSSHSVNNATKVVTRSSVKKETVQKQSNNTKSKSKSKQKKQKKKWYQFRQN